MEGSVFPAMFPCRWRPPGQTARYKLSEHVDSTTVLGLPRLLIISKWLGLWIMEGC